MKQPIAVMRFNDIDVRLLMALGASYAPPDKVVWEGLGIGEGHNSHLSFKAIMREWTATFPGHSP